VVCGLSFSQVGGVFISLAVLAVGFQLSDINSPTVTIDESLSMNDTCSSYRYKYK
jgi:hypothetical protein